MITSSLFRQSIWQRSGRFLAKYNSQRSIQTIKNASLSEDQEMSTIVHPDWYRFPQEDDDPRMIGDYPDVPAGSYQLRDPYVKYFDQQQRRNFGEPITEDYEPLLMWSFDVETQFSKWTILGTIGGFVGGMCLLYQIFGKMPSPYAGKTAPKELPTVAEYFKDGKIPKHVLAG